MNHFNTLNDRTPFPALRYPTKGVVVCYERPVAAPVTPGIYYYAPSGDFTPQDIYEVYQTMADAERISGGGVQWPLPSKDHDVSKGRLPQVDRDAALALGYNPICVVPGAGWVFWGNHVVIDAEDDSVPIPYLMVWDSFIRQLVAVRHSPEGTIDDALWRQAFSRSLTEWSIWVKAVHRVTVDFHSHPSLDPWVAEVIITIGSYSRRAALNYGPVPPIPLQHFYEYEDYAPEERPELPDYCTGDVWPKGEDQEKLLAFDNEAPLFPVGQSYENHTSKPLKCAKCGNTEFRVAQGHVYTAISCPQCNWVCGIHSG